MARTGLLGLPAQAVKTARLYAPALIADRRAPERRFCVWSPGRSGTQLLVELLDSHPALHCDNEILFSRVRYPFSYVQACAARASGPGIEAYGFKVVYGQLQTVQSMRDPAAFLHRLSRAGYLMVAVTRRNLLRQAISWTQANTSGDFHFRGEERQRERAVHLEPTHLIARMWFLEETINSTHAAVADVPHETVWYEDDLADPTVHQATADRIVRRLGLQPQPVRTSLNRVRGDAPYEELVENWDEVRDVLVRTRFAEWLED
jgi:LPS sulfotransferase NodH